MKARMTISECHWSELFAHLFPGDGDEHGAVLRCGLSQTPAGVRLLVREVILARDGVDYVPGSLGYRKLDAGFVLDKAMSFAADGSVYVAVHCHGGTSSVAFSQTDLTSHELGYPGLLDLIGGPAVGALVFARNAVAGDLWLSDGQRLALDDLVVVGRNRLALTPGPLPTAVADTRFDRQARLFGDRGQEALSSLKIAVVGLGGGGSLIAEMLAHLGVGTLVFVDNDRIDPTNLPRVVGATRRDAHVWMRDPRRPEWLRDLGERWAARKVQVAKREALRAGMSRVIDVFGDVADPEVAAALLDCDHLFLAADSHTARLVVNAIAHQYLIPVTQVGAKVDISPESGDVTNVFSVSRLLHPGRNCLRCNGLISAARLREEATDPTQLRRQRYVDDDDVIAPSVITLNAVAASFAVDEWLMRTVGLSVSPLDWLQYDALGREVFRDGPRRDENCPQCGPTRFGRGDAVRLPTRLT
jgi:molybdopterin/thiamine biosynthesis adenylyltransferase